MSRLDAINSQALTPQVEKDFLKTLSLIRSKDPKIYDNKSKFYEDEDQIEDASNAKSENKKPVFLKDVERERLLTKGVKALVSDSESDDEENKTQQSKADDLTYVEEQRQLKESFKTATEDDNEDDENESFLKLREKSTDDKEKDEQDYKEWLSSANVQDSKKQDDEKFLANYILNKGYQDQDKDIIPSYSSIIDESGSDIEEEEEFERKFNFRFEEPDEEFIKRFPRTIKESARRADDKRKKKRQSREDRKTKEKEVKKEEIRKLKNLKRKEIMTKIERLKEITGNSKVGFLEDDLDGDFDASKYDDIMKNVYDDDYYKADEEEIEKPTFSDSEGSQENWDEWTGNYNDNFGAEEDLDEEFHCEDAEFNMDADYQPTAKKPRNTLKDQGKHSKFANALDQKKPVFNPDEKTFEEYFDEYYKLDYEDIIADLPVRFKYRQVLPNNFGLSTDEILTAEDKELNQWCSLRKPISYNTKEEEWRERLKYKKKARNKQKKARVFQSIYSNQSSAGEAVNEQETVGESGESKPVTGSKTAKKRKSVLNNNDNHRYRVISSKWKKGSNLQNEAVSKRKRSSNPFKQGNQDIVSNLSSSRLAAYGIDTKRKKRKTTQKM